MKLINSFFFQYKNDPDFMAFLEAEGKTKLLELANEESGSEEEEEEKKDEENEKEVPSLAHAPISDLEVSFLKLLFHAFKKDLNFIYRIKNPIQLQYLKMKTKGQDTKESIQILNVEKPKEVEKCSLFTVKLKNLPYATKKKDIKVFLSPVVPASIRLAPKVKGIAYIGFKTEKAMRQAIVKNKGFISKETELPIIIIFYLIAFLK